MDQPSGSDAVIILCTCPSQEVAESLAGQLVAEQLAACVNIVPNLVSVYLWKGQVEKDSELLLLIKSTQDFVDRVKSHIVKNHPYELPEIVAVPIVAGLDPYIAWIRDSLKT